MKISKVGERQVKAVFKQDIQNKSIENLPDKFLFERNKTIGFRKDRKLYKFVGVRDGYSKQMEFTLKSVNIDGNEMIASNRVNFTDVEASGETVIHKINDLSLYNSVDVGTYRNIVVVENPFDVTEITYEVHLRGISVDNEAYYENGKMRFKQDYNGRYNIVDAGNGNTVFSIENPVMTTENGVDVLTNMTHELWIEDGRYMYKKVANREPDAIFPVYIDVNVTFNSTDYSSIKSYNANQNQNISWSHALTADNTFGHNIVTLNRDAMTWNRFDYLQPNLITAWTNTGVYSFVEHTLEWFDITNTDHTKMVVSNPISVEGGTNLIMHVDVSMNAFDTGDSNIVITESGQSYQSTDVVPIPSNNIYDYVHTVSQSADTAYVSFEIFGTGQTMDVTLVDFTVKLSGFTSSAYYTSFVQRQFLYFDTRLVHKETLEKLQLSFDLEQSTGDYIIHRANTSSDDSIDVGDFGSRTGHYLATFDASTSGHTVIDLGSYGVDDFVSNTMTKLVISEYNYDYMGALPTSPYLDEIKHNWSYELIADLNKITVTGSTVISLDLLSDGFGVLRSNGTTYNDAYSGATNVVLVHSSTVGTYESGATYEYDLSNYTIYRTFLNFDTSRLTIYDRYIVTDVTLELKNYMYDDDVSIFKGTQDPSVQLGTSEFMSFSEQYASVNLQTTGETAYVTIPIDAVHATGNTMFVVRNLKYDVSGATIAAITSESFGIDFSQTVLKIELEPYTIYGISYIQVRKDESVTIYASKNTSEGEIWWANDLAMTELILSGSSLDINGLDYEDGDYVYAAILDDTGNVISVNTLSIEIDVISDDYGMIPERGVYEHTMDIDAVYFKYHKCLSGVTYSYARAVDDIYEQNREVSDGDGLGSYNMYNEFDIIDEFFSNSHEVEVVWNLDDVDLSKSQKRIGGVYIHEGTRVLLISNPASENDGVYVADYNLMLRKTDELSDEEKAFRYKAHVDAGMLLDYEFHTMYYTGGPPSDTFNYDYIDADMYSDDVIDMSIYSDLIFDANSE